MLSEFHCECEAYRILPFGVENPLSRKVLSNHAELVLKNPDNHIINIWSLNRSACHQLEENASLQISTIAERFVKGEVLVQVLIEGNASFYEDLAEKIKSLGGKFFQMFTFPNAKGKFVDGNSNGSCILINKSKFSIIESGKISSLYLDDDACEKKFSLPYVSILDKFSGQGMTIGAVNLGPDGSECCANALMQIVKSLKIFQNRKMGFDSLDIVLAGDYGTVPSNVRKSVLGAFHSYDVVFLKASYPTCVNEKNEAVAFDQAIVFGNRKFSYRLLSSYHSSLSSRSLIKSIARSRENYLKQ